MRREAADAGLGRATTSLPPTSPLAPLPLPRRSAARHSSPAPPQAAAAPSALSAATAPGASPPSLAAGGAGAGAALTVKVSEAVGGGEGEGVCNAPEALAEGVAAGIADALADALAVSAHTPVSAPHSQPTAIQVKHQRLVGERVNANLCDPPAIVVHAPAQVRPGPRGKDGKGDADRGVPGGMLQRE